MRITRQHLFWTIVFSCLVETRSRFSTLNNRSAKDFFEDILSEVLQTSRAKDVLLVLRNSLLDGQASDILDKIFAATSRHVPTLCVNANQTEPSRVSSCGMSRDLVVYIYVSEREPDIVEGELVAKDMNSLTHDRVRPKVLVLMILRRPCRNLIMLFRAMWSRNILDAIVVEYSGAPEYSDKYSTIVHRYNPFTNSQNDEPYSVDTVWFTKDFPNMHGYPLVYVFTHRLPYSNIVSSTEQKLNGIDTFIINILEDKMNFTGIPNIITEQDKYLRRMSNGTLCGILVDIASKKYDALLTTLAILGNMSNTLPGIRFTYPFFHEKWCFVVPRLLVKQNFTSTALRLLVLNFSIVGIFWLCSRLMKFNPNEWHLVKIVGIMLGVSFPPVSTKLHERIILLSIFAVYACYSSTLFVELTSISFKNNLYVEYNHLQDLINSNFALIMNENIKSIITQFNSAFSNQVFKLSKKIATVSETELCVKNLLTYQNVSCFIQDNWARMLAVNNMQNGESMLQITKLCYLSPPVGYVFQEGSPYVKRVSNLFLKLTEGGFYYKWFREFIWNETKESTIQINRHQTNSMCVNVYHSMIYVLIIGYSISALVFIGELIWKQFNINLNFNNIYHLLNLKKNLKKNK